MIADSLSILALFAGKLCAEAVMVNSPRIIPLCKFLPLRVHS